MTDKMIVLVRSEYAIGTLGPGYVFGSVAEAEQAILDDACWVADAYDIPEPQTLEALDEVIMRHSIPVEYQIETLNL